MSIREHYRVLPQIKAATTPCYVMESIDIESVTADSPALQAMTDLSLVPTATTSPHFPLEQANSSMIQHGVRLLVVTGESGRIVGLSPPPTSSERSRCWWPSKKACGAVS